MQKIHKSIIINAPREKVWNAILEDATYREWTSVFCPGSHFEGSWEEGSKIVFLGPGEDGQEGGMVSRIKESRPYEFISIEHLGEVKNGVEVTPSDTMKEWIGALENYTLKEVPGGTEFSLDQDITEKERTFMDDAWDKALVKLKEIAERK